jgi:hypothetical protein
MAAWLSLGVGLLPLVAHETPTTKLTWNREISRLFEARCMRCHSEGGPAPMPLTTYTDVRPWAVAIKEEVLTRSMPPWPAAKGFGHFANDISLPQEEINTIAAWAEGGAPEGEPEFARLYPMVRKFAPAPAPAGAPRVLQGRLDAPVSIRAISAKNLPAGRKIYAISPDGRFFPLVWPLAQTRQLNPQAWLIPAPAIDLPAGTVIHNGPLTVVAP